MAWRKVKLPATLENTPIVIHYNAEYAEYRVRIVGDTKADYFTNDKDDALATGQQMRNTLLRKNPAPKRKTAARTQKAAESYVRRPSQITKKAPSARLKKRRTVNLQSPRGVFPNPASRLGEFYKNYRAFSAAARIRGQDAKALIASGKYVVEDDGHILAKVVMPKKKTVAKASAKAKNWVFVQKAYGKNDWSYLGYFDDTPDGAARAIEYAKAYAAKDPKAKIRVFTGPMK